VRLKSRLYSYNITWITNTIAGDKESIFNKTNDVLIVNTYRNIFQRRSNKVLLLPGTALGSPSVTVFKYRLSTHQFHLAHNNDINDAANVSKVTTLLQDRNVFSIIMIIIVIYHCRHHPSHHHNHPWM